MLWNQVHQSISDSQLPIRWHSLAGGLKMKQPEVSSLIYTYRGACPERLCAATAALIVNDAL